MTQSWLEQYFNEVQQVAQQLDLRAIDQMVERLVRLREEGGRLFLCGVGGSAGNCSHAVNDFRKLTGIDASSPVDNVSELTARTNDDGWTSIFGEWLKVSRANSRDVLFVMSVGGGNKDKNVSPNLVVAIEEAKSRQMTVMGIVGRDGGHTKLRGDIVVLIPTVNPDAITPHTEAFQAVVWHAIVCDPRLMVKGNKWETLGGGAAPAPKHS